MTVYWSERTAVLGDSVLVWYEGRNLAVYENGVSSPGTMVTTTTGLQPVWGMSSDGISRFLVCDRNNAVFILDVRGKLCELTLAVWCLTVQWGTGNSGWCVEMETSLSCHHVDTATTL